MKRIFLYIILTICSLKVSAADFTFKEGDIVFRSGKNYPVMYISASTITHCGIIVKTPDGLRILEADGKVKLHTIEEFFGKKIDKAEKLTKRVTDKILKIDYQQFLGKKYDNQFSLNNNTFYCSELVYFIYKNQFGIELCTPKPLRDHHTLGLRWLLKKRGINLDEPVVTPADLYKEYITAPKTDSQIKILELPEGELAWTTERPKNAKMCIPAAFTDLSGNVEGEYRQEGVIHNPNKRFKVSICKDIFFIDRQWHSDSGFQQLVLVKNGKPSTFRDSRIFVRRALCKKDKHVFLVESRHRMTMTDFAAECAKSSSYAVYLDTGKYGYGHIGKKKLSPWAYFSRNKQTNWLYVK